MKIILRETSRTVFNGCSECDCLSATANMGGYLNVVVYSLYRDYYQLICNAADTCNQRKEISVLPDLCPKLFLVPKTRRAESDRADFYIHDLLNAVTAVRGTALHFTHYAFMRKLSMESEVVEILKALNSLDAQHSLRKIVIDVDVRAIGQFRKIMKGHLTP